MMETSQMGWSTEAMIAHAWGKWNYTSAMVGGWKGPAGHRGIYQDQAVWGEWEEPTLS